jgi:hypothetical protein
MGSSDTYTGETISHLLYLGNLALIQRATRDGFIYFFSCGTGNSLYMQGPENSLDNGSGMDYWRLSK